MILLICGLPGSGKSSVAKAIAKRMNLKIIHTSGVLKQLKEKKIGEINLEKAEENTGFFESEEGFKFFEDRRLDESMDKITDAKLLEIIEKENDLVMDSWTMPWLSKKGIKIWLEASEKIRVKRAAKRDEKNLEGMIEKLKRREFESRAIYKKLYNFEFGKDLSVFHKIINTDNLSVKQVCNKIEKFLKEK